MSRYSYPHTIDDGAGERLTFLRRVAGQGGDRLEVQNVVAPGAGPIMHVHHYQTEGLTVQQGRIGYQRLGEVPHLTLAAHKPRQPAAGGRDLQPRT